MKQLFPMVAVFTVLMFFVSGCKSSSEKISDSDINNSISDNDLVYNENDINNSISDNDLVDTGSDKEVIDAVDNDSEEESPETLLKYKKADEHAEAVSENIVKANSDLGMKIFDAVSSNETGKNVMISPLSISIAMAMVTNGASGENLKEMKEVLGFNEMEMSAVNTQFYKLIQSLVEADKDMVLSIANSVWMDDSFKPYVLETFLKALIENYGAEPFTIDFQAQKAVDKINSWVSENTNGKIPTIIDEIGEDAVMYLINAIYFKAAWTTEFYKDWTYDGKFKISDGSEKTVKMMLFRENQTLQYKNTGDYRVVRLPYGREKFAFYGILPDEKYNIDEFITDMKINGIEKYLEDVRAVELPVYIPRFKFNFGVSLVDIFKSFGMEKAFETGGFLNLADPGAPLYISNILHKTFIEVNEEGTEAAAVTVIEDSGDTGEEEEDPPSFRADRPFVFVIRDDRSGTILFIGKVEDPSKE
jgi:serpin B